MEKTAKRDRVCRNIKCLLLVNFQKEDFESLKNDSTQKSGLILRLHPNG